MPVVSRRIRSAVVPAGVVVGGDVETLWSLNAKNLIPVSVSVTPPFVTVVTAPLRPAPPPAAHPAAAVPWRARRQPARHPGRPAGNPLPVAAGRSAADRTALRDTDQRHRGGGAAALWLAVAHDGPGIVGACGSLSQPAAVRPCAGECGDCAAR